MIRQGLKEAADGKEAQPLRECGASGGAVQCRGLIHGVVCAVLCENREKEDSEATHMRERKKEAAKLEVSQQPCTPCHAPMASCGLIHRV